MEVRIQDSSQETMSSLVPWTGSGHASDPVERRRPTGQKVGPDGDSTDSGHWRFGGEGGPEGGESVGLRFGAGTGALPFPFSLLAEL